MPLERNGRTGRRSLLALLPYLSRYKRPLISGCLMVFLTNAAAVVSPWVLRNAIDDLAQEITRNKLTTYAALILVVSLVEGAFRFLMRRILIGVSRRVEFDLRNDLFAHLQKLSARFYQRFSTGDLMARATNDLNNIRSVLGPGIMYSLNTLFTTVLTVSLLVTIEPRLAVLTLIPLVLVSLSVKYFGKRIHQRSELIQEQFSRLTTLAQESISGIRTIKAFHQQSAFLGLFRQENQSYVDKSLSLVKLQGIYNPLLVFLLGVSSLLVLLFGGRLAVRGAISVGDLVAFMAYLVMLTWPTIALGWVINVVERGAASMGRLNEIFGSQPEDSVPGPPVHERIRGDIEVRGLTFSYNGHPVLQDLRFTIPAGSTLAVVGKTGSGKSTIAHLLCRLYPVERDQIRIGGRDLNDIPLATLRKRIGYVQQDTFLFSETIRQNIALGKPGAQPESIERVSKVSHLLPDILSFPNGFETMVGERGITLSGGQKQRISISRALLIDPDILILDDALSSVDTYTEELILRHLKRERAERTVLMISHRISTVQDADQILVLDDGRVAEIGHHQQLLSQDGLYRRLYEQQKLREELEIE